MSRIITTKTTDSGNEEVTIIQDGLKFVNIKGTTTINIYDLNDNILNCHNLGDPNDSFKRWVTRFLKENE